MPPSVIAGALAIMRGRLDVGELDVTILRDEVFDKRFFCHGREYQLRRAKRGEVG